MTPLCFGGSFNPIHHGHLICARAVAEAAGFDRVMLIPSGRPPHKSQPADLAEGRDRLAMCRLAAATQPDLFDVDDLEIGRQGPSFTLLTIRQLRQRGWPEVHWLIGADMLIDLPNWHQSLALLGEARFVVMARPGWQFDWNSLGPMYRHLERNVVTAPLVQISGTDIRRRLAEGRSIAYLVPESVRQYIEAHGLYRPRPA